MTQTLNRIGIAFFLITVVGTAFSADNWISRLTDEEYQSLLTYRPDPDYIEPLRPFPLGQRDLPDQFDWREQSGVTPVKNQGQCGSCWAFAATAVIESQVLINSGLEVDVSEQQLVDCTPGSSGCNGGSYSSAFDYLAYEGLRLEADYPYEAQNGNCRAEQAEPYYRVTGWQYINTDVDVIKSAIMEHGPVATVIGANDNLKAYTGGCYHDTSNTSVNHGVTIIGWDDTVCAPTGAWIVKNSWGSDWGDNGCFYIQYGDVHIGEQAAIATVEEIPPVVFHLTKWQVMDSDGYIGPNEYIDLRITLINRGRDDSSDGVVQLSSANPNIQIDTSEIPLPAIPSKTTIEISDVFTLQTSADLNPGDAIEFTLRFTWNGYLSEETFTAYAGPQFIISFNDFEGLSDDGWTHGYTLKKDDWARSSFTPDMNPIHDPRHPYSGEKMWGNNLIKTGNYANEISNYLSSPVFDCSQFDRVIMSFQRYATVEEARFDQITIRVNDVEIWKNPTSGHLIDTDWVYCAYDITDAIANDPSNVQITFTLTTDEGLQFGGWNIDDFMLFTGVDDAFESRFNEPITINMHLSQSLFETDDLFSLTFDTHNYRATPRSMTDWVVLDVYNTYYFWPSWDVNVDHRDRSLSAFEHSSDTILEFNWPAVEGHATGIRFWGAAMSADLTDVFDYTMIEWGW